MRRQSSLLAAALAIALLSASTAMPAQQVDHYVRLTPENAAIGIYRVSVDGRQIRANPALARLNGYGSEAELVAAVEAEGRHWYVDPARLSDLWRLHGRLAVARGEPSRGIAFLTKALRLAE